MYRIVLLIFVLSISLFACQEDFPVVPPVYEIRITVVDSLQQPVADAWVHVFNDFGDWSAERAENPTGTPITSSLALETGITDANGQVVFEGIIRPTSVLNETVFTPEGMYMRATSAQVINADTSYLTNDPTGVNTGFENSYLPFDTVMGGGREVLREVIVEVR